MRPAGPSPALAGRLAHAPLLSPLLIVGAFLLLGDEPTEGLAWLLAGVALSAADWALRRRGRWRIALAVAGWLILVALALGAMPGLGAVFIVMTIWFSAIAIPVWIAARKSLTRR
ncbi:hypothetical protein [Luteimonas abyssi]|uniref:hypothetical protein n=1 Tax=Luteimonas abyssi TaxID=1247514 RepID=UPI000737CCDA|nr:hypothetical protein [Luteimonas abyssi]